MDLDREPRRVRPSDPLERPSHRYGLRESTLAVLKSGYRRSQSCMNESSIAYLRSTVMIGFVQDCHKPHKHC